jgi:hypothetical protein
MGICTLHMFLFIEEILNFLNRYFAFCLLVDYFSLYFFFFFVNLYLAYLCFQICSIQSFLISSYNQLCYFTLFSLLLPFSNHCLFSSFMFFLDIFIALTSAIISSEWIFKTALAFLLTREQKKHSNTKTYTVFVSCKKSSYCSYVRDSETPTQYV